MHIEVAWHRRVAAGLLAVALVTAVGLWLSGERTQISARSPSGSGAPDYRGAVARLDLQIAGAADLARARPTEWMFPERLAGLLLTRARLTGSFEDYAEAQRQLDLAFRHAGQKQGPHQLQMALAFSTHRLNATERMAKTILGYAVRPGDDVLSEITLTRGDLAFYRGDYAHASTLYRSVGEAGDAGKLRMANLLARTGRPVEALALLDQQEAALTLPSAQSLADLALRRGSIILQQGDWTEARAQFARARSLFPGWWLADALYAQTLAVEGHTTEAATLLEACTRTGNHPECMDILASIYRADGATARSQFWVRRADAAWNRGIALVPEAALGHAAEHALAFGDASTALDLARRDYRLRPYGQTATTLAWALLSVGDAAGALKLVDQVIDGGWVSAETHLAREQALLLLGRTRDAQAERTAALEINPHAGSPVMAMIWLGH